MRTLPGPEKLIRDRIPAIAAAEGRALAVRTAGPEEMARLLGLKLVEEAHEALGALGAGRTPELLDELADLQTVIDEIAGQMIPLLALHGFSIPGALLSFALFRLFDIWKPGPVAWADRRKDEFGIMGDDIVAGLMAWVVMLLLHLVSP